MIGDDDPLWEQHSGLDLHRGTEWAQGDENFARQVCESASPNAWRILDLLIDHPGEQLSADDVAPSLAMDLPARRRPTPWSCGKPGRYSHGPAGIARASGVLLVAG
jgi:hypothetical protein